MWLDNTIHSDFKNLGSYTQKTYSQWKPEQSTCKGTWVTWVKRLRDIMLCEVSFDYFSKELPEMPILILFIIIDICFDFRISTVPQWQVTPLLLSTKCFFFFNKDSQVKESILLKQQ